MSGGVRILARLLVATAVALALAGCVEVWEKERDPEDPYPSVDPDQKRHCVSAFDIVRAATDREP